MCTKSCLFLLHAERGWKGSIVNTWPTSYLLEHPPKVSLDSAGLEGLSLWPTSWNQETGCTTAFWRWDGSIFISFNTSGSYSAEELYSCLQWETLACRQGSKAPHNTATPGEAWLLQLHFCSRHVHLIQQLQWYRWGFEATRNPYLPVPHHLFPKCPVALLSEKHQLAHVLPYSFTSSRMTGAWQE